MEHADATLDVLDAQVIFNVREAAPSLDLEPTVRDALAVEMGALALECAGVDGALWHGEAHLCDAATERYPDVFRGMVYFVDPDIPDMEDQLARIKAHPGLVGVRLTPGWPPTGENIERLRAGAYDRWFAELERLDLALSFFIVGSLPAVPAVAEAHSSLRILIDHVGLSPVPQVPLVPERFDALPDLLALRRYENVAIKFTGVPSLSDESYPFADLWPVCHQMLESFGPERLMWGSDFRRVLPLGVSYGEILDFVKLTDELSADEKRMLLADSLRKWVGWEKGS
jgi:L-fuconolactonase